MHTVPLVVIDVSHWAQKIKRAKLQHDIGGLTASNQIQLLSSPANSNLLRRCDQAQVWHAEESADLRTRKRLWFGYELELELDARPVIISVARMRKSSCPSTLSLLIQKFKCTVIFLHFLLPT